MQIGEVTTRLRGGIPKIEGQHEKVLQYHRQVEALLASGREDFVVLEGALDGLIQYTITCFDFEERLMSLAAYPRMAEHMKSHDMFMRRLSSYRNSVQNGKYAANELMSLLRIWVAGHIHGQDAEFIATMRERYGVA